jgi:hypothetical protein
VSFGNFGPEILHVVMVFLVLGTAVTMLISESWRLSILALALQYVGVFVLVAGSWSITLALVKLVAGWIAGSVLAMAMRSIPQVPPSPHPVIYSLKIGRFTTNILSLSGELFRLLAAGMIVLVVITLAPRATEWVPGIRPGQALGALALIGLGLLHLGLTAQPFRVILGLLTILAGFEVIYAAVETSTLVAGLLAGINLILALVGAFLLIAPIAEAEL